MNLNANSRYAVNPTNLRAQNRSKFDLSHRIKTTFNVGELVPFDVTEVLPGDTFNVETNTLARLQTLITPLMDDLYLDFFYFFVPNRLVWEHWKQFNGESENAWIPETTYTVPQITVKGDDDIHKSILDYMGIPTFGTGSSDVSFSINSLPIRAYCLIWNEWFRDENLQDPLLVPVDDSNYEFDSSKPYTGGNLLKVNKYHDYFTSALPSPQKGPDVSIPLAPDGLFPVTPVKNKWVGDYGFDPKNSDGLSFSCLDGTTLDQGRHAAFFDSYYSGPSENVYLSIDKTVQGSGVETDKVYPDNLFVNLKETSVASINTLRLAFATQQLYELDARGGTRYVEILKAHFGVTSPDARQQRPELLSYAHLPININQVVQQSSTNDTTALGDVAGLSVTADSQNSFVKSFTEHGFVIGLCCARYKHSYQQGLNRLWSRQTRFDYYWPVFANLGEQPILNKEIYLDRSNLAKNEEVFGYQEAWSEYRYTPDIVTAEMRSDYAQTLDFWHLADEYSALPKLSNEWIQEDSETVNRVLAVSDNLSAQLFMDILVKNEATRPMPLYSIPGLTRM